MAVEASQNLEHGRIVSSETSFPLSFRDPRYQITNEYGRTYHLSAKQLRERWDEVQPTDPKDRQAGTRYTLIWTGPRSLRHNAPGFSLRGASCKPDQFSPKAVIASYLGFVQAETSA